VDEGHDCVLWRLPHHLPPTLGTPWHRRLEHGSCGPPPQGYRTVYTRGHTFNVLALGGMLCPAISAAKRAALGSSPVRELCWGMPYRVSRHTAWHHHQRPVRALSRTLETPWAPRDDPSRSRGRPDPIARVGEGRTGTKTRDKAPAGPREDQM
jgi:hypothetical protein